MIPEEMVARLEAIEVEVARARGLDLSSSSARRALREHLVRLERSEPTIEARISVHGPALQVGLGERYGVSTGGQSDRARTGQSDPVITAIEMAAGSENEFTHPGRPN